MPKGRVAAAVAVALAAMSPLGNAGGRGGGARPPSPVRARDATDSLLWMEMRNVDLHIDEQQVIHMRVLRGQVIPTTPGATAFLDDPKSFRVRVTNGVVALSGDAVGALLNEIAFNYPDAPIKHLHVRIEKGQLVQKGTLHKGVDIPFEMWATPVLANDGKLRLHPDKLHIFSVNGLTLMHALGLHHATMMDLRKAHGVTVAGDDLFVDPLLLIPPPMVEGRLRAVRIEDSLLVQEFTRTTDDTIFGTYVRPDSGSHNFVYFRGGELRFGKLTMRDTDLLINDDDERDPLDLYLAHYNTQLAAGHTKNLPDLGLRTWMVDYHVVANTRTAAAR
jgi:hypothetical protein